MAVNSAAHVNTCHCLQLLQISCIGTYLACDWQLQTAALSHLYHCVQDSSTGAGAGYEQDVQQFKNGDLKKGAKDNIKKVGSTINKKANQGGTKVSMHLCLQHDCLNSCPELLEVRSLRRQFAAIVVCTAGLRASLFAPNPMRLPACNCLRPAMHNCIYATAEEGGFQQIWRAAGCFWRQVEIKFLGMLLS